MGGSTQRPWALARRQHWVVTRAQLLSLGFTPHAIDHRVERGRLHPVHRGVYAVGRRELSRNGHWMAAVLACGDDAVLSHDSAAALWGFRPDAGRIHVVAPSARQRPGITVHRRADIDATHRHGIPVTTPAATVVDLAATHPRDEVEQALNEGDLRGLIDLRELRARLDALPTRRPGVAKLRGIIDRRTFTFTRSGLERRYLPISDAAGLPRPLSRTTAAPSTARPPSRRPTAAATRFTPRPA